MPRAWTLSVKERGVGSAGDTMLNTGLYFPAHVVHHKVQVIDLLRVDRCS